MKTVPVGVKVEAWKDATSSAHGKPKLSSSNTFLGVPECEGWGCSGFGDSCQRWAEQFLWVPFRFLLEEKVSVHLLVCCLSKQWSFCGPSQVSSSYLRIPKSDQKLDNSPCRPVEKGDRQQGLPFRFHLSRGRR